MTSRAARLAASISAAGTGLLAASRYGLARRVRGPEPRVGLAGAIEVLVVGILVVSLVAASMILLDPWVPALRLHLPLWIVRFFERITDLGLGGTVLWPLGIALLVVLGLMPRLDSLGRRIAAATVARLGFLFVSIAGSGLIVLVLKYLLGRARPYVILHLTGPNAQLTFDWFAMRASYASFPSGHSAIIFATAVAFAALFPRARGLLLALATLVAISRVVLSSHFPSDVVAGAAVATLFTLLMVKAFARRRLAFCVADDGSIRPMRGLRPRWLVHLIPPSSASALEEARP